MAYSVPAPYEDAVRSGLTIRYRVSASRGGAPVAGATALDPEGGSWVDDARRDGRRSLSLDLAPAPGLFGLLEPLGTTLTLTCIVTYLGTTATIPCGVYDVDAENSGEVDGLIRIQAPDKWARIRRARFLRPQKSTPTALVREQIATLIRGALGASEPVVITATSTATVGVQVWERDRDKAILELAESIGAWVFFDRDGVATVADVPTIGPAATWTVDADRRRGVLLSVDRERSRERTYNVVVASTSRSDGVVPFDPVYVWDSDPASPTYAGPNPLTSPGSAGPFGIVPYFYESPLLRSAGQATSAARAILHRVTGLASQASLGSAPNPAVDALDVIDVAPPPERYDIPRPVERHMVDKVTHPLDVETEQRIEGRSTRTDEYA